MPEETRYVTLSGLPPNGGVPPGRIFASIVGLPFGHNLGPYGAGFIPRPIYTGPQYNPPPPRNRAPYEPPVQYLDRNLLHDDGGTYIIPTEVTTFNFVSDGTNPCEAPNGYHPYSFAFVRRKAPSGMTVEDLIRGLGAFEDEENGVQEVLELGPSWFTPGRTVRLGSVDAGKTLREVGWTQEKSERKPIWLVAKRRYG